MDWTWGSQTLDGGRSRRLVLLDICSSRPPTGEERSEEEEEEEQEGMGEFGSGLLPRRRGRR